MDISDIDVLAAAVRIGDGNTRFDVNEDDAVNDDDVDFLIDNILSAVRGDTDLSGTVDFSDFLALSANFGAENVGWAEGDTNGDGTVSFDDFLTLSANFGIEAEDA